MTIKMDESKEIGRITEAAQEIAYAVDMDANEVAEWLIDWAIDSQSIAGICFQIAAAQEFGATLSTYTLSEIEKRGMNAGIDFAEERAILRHIYNGRKAVTITLYRGTDHDESNALESWTASRNKAQFYVERNGSGQVIEREFSADEILGGWLDGIGLECADEIVVINR